MGETAVLKVDAIPSKPYHGKVVEVGSSGFNRPAQPDVTFFQVKILLDDPDPNLRASMSVRAEINTAAHAAALVAPIQAVVEREPLNPGNGGKSTVKDSGRKPETVKVVFVVEGGKARQRQVTTGISDETHVELTTGAKAGEQLVTGPYRTLKDLKDGDPVTVSKTSEEDDRKTGTTPDAAKKG